MAKTSKKSSHPFPAGGGTKASSHPGFAAVQSKIASEGYSSKVAGAILASKTRGASKSAKTKNPNLKKVK